jgi:hypothetical protein
MPISHRSPDAVYNAVHSRLKLRGVPQSSSSLFPTRKLLEDSVAAIMITGTLRGVHMASESGPH